MQRLIHNFDGQDYIGTKVVKHSGVDYQEFRSADIRRPSRFYATLQPDGSYIKIADSALKKVLYEAHKPSCITDKGVVFRFAERLYEYTPEMIEQVNRMLANSRQQYFKEYADYYTRRWGKYYGFGRGNAKAFKKSIISRLNAEIVAFKFDPDSPITCYASNERTVYFNSMQAINRKAVRLHEIDHGGNYFPAENRIGTSYFNTVDYETHLGGDALTEGITVHVTDSPRCRVYRNETQLARILSAFVGEGNLIRSQQLGVDEIEQKYNTLMGRHKFVDLMLRMDDNLEAHNIVKDLETAILPSEVARQAGMKYGVKQAHDEILDLVFSDFGKAIDNISTYKQAQEMAGIVKNLRNVAIRHSYMELEPRIDKVATQLKWVAKRKFEKSPRTSRSVLGLAAGFFSGYGYSVQLMEHKFGERFPAIRENLNRALYGKRRILRPSIAQVMMDDLEREMRWLVARNRAPENQVRLEMLTYSYERLRIEKEFYALPYYEALGSETMRFQSKNAITGIAVEVEVADPYNYFKGYEFYHKPFSGNREMVENIARESNLRDEVFGYEWKYYNTVGQSSQLQATKNVWQEATRKLDSFLDDYVLSQQSPVVPQTQNRKISSIRTRLQGIRRVVDTKGTKVSAALIRPVTPR